MSTQRGGRAGTFPRTLARNSAHINSILSPQGPPHSLLSFLFSFLSLPLPPFLSPFLPPFLFCKNPGFLSPRCFHNSIVFCPGHAPTHQTQKPPFLRNAGHFGGSPVTTPFTNKVAAAPEEPDLVKTQKKALSQVPLNSNLVPGLPYEPICRLPTMFSKK